jgi:hypothetical protein
MLRYNRLLTVIRSSLISLDKALQGLQVSHTDGDISELNAELAVLSDAECACKSE